MKKKLFTLIWILLLWLCACPAWAAPVLLVEAPDTAQAGERFTVVVRLTGNTGFEGCQFGLLYDNRYLLPTTAKGSGYANMMISRDFFSAMNSGGQPMCSMILADSTLHTGDAALYTLEFQAVGMPPSGTTTLRLCRRYDNGSETPYLTAGYQAVAGVTTVDKTLTVTPGALVPVGGVSLNSRQLILTQGQKYSLLQATLAPVNATNTNLIWSSSDSAVVTVDAYKQPKTTVYAKGLGTATVTVTTADGSYSASCPVTVVIPVTGVTLDQTTATLYPGSRAYLTATVAPANASIQSVVWSSDRESVATVNANGTVTGVAPGTATITATTTQGSKTASCLVTVTSGLQVSGTAQRTGQGLALSVTVANRGNADEGNQLLLIGVYDAAGRMLAAYQGAVAHVQKAAPQQFTPLLPLSSTAQPAKINVFLLQNGSLTPVLTPQQILFSP